MLRPLSTRTALVFFAGLSGIFNAPVDADDWPMLGRDGTRNAVSPESGAPTDWSIGVLNPDTGRWDGSSHVLWTAKLGRQTHSTPVVSGGLLWVGTSVDLAGGPTHSALKCFRVADGRQVYEYDLPTRGPRIHDPGWTGLGSSPLIEGDRLWLATNRGEVLCLDIGPLLREEGPPRELWKLDLVSTFDVFLHVPLMGPPCPCSIGPSWNGRIFVTIHNGVDESHTKVPKPDAPSLVCLNKDSGELHWKDSSPGSNVLVTQFASPTVASLGGHDQVIVPQGDGWLRAFDPQTGEMLWEFDVNPKSTIHRLGGGADRNSLLGNAVVYDNRVYLASAQDADKGDGQGRLVCVDPTKRGDISSELAVDADGNALPHRRVQAVNPKAGEKAIPNPNSALVWEFRSTGSGQKFEDAIHRVSGSVVVAKGLVIAADFSGIVHCFDARTGQRHWTHDTIADIWTSPLIVDDKVYVADGDGEISIYGLSSNPNAAMRKVNGEYDPLHEIAMGAEIYSSPVFVNGVLYLATRAGLFAIAADKNQPDPSPTGGYWPQWRGPDRDNVSTETGLLQDWPAAGPPLKWRLQGLGEGISPVSLAGGRIFAIGQFETTEYVRALDGQTGEHLWTAVVGTAERQNPLMRWLTQRPPTVDGERVYAISLLGELVCLRTADGSELWWTKYQTDLGGKRGIFGFSDCPLVDEQRLICTPGGPDAPIAALDKNTGKVLWRCAVPDGGRATYSNGILTTIDDKRQFITFLERTLVGVDVGDGRVLWRVPVTIDQAHTPLVRGRTIGCINFQTGIRLLEIHRDQDVFVARELYSRTTGFLTRLQDDTILLENRLYESANGVFSCFDLKNGDAIWQHRFGQTSAVTHADGRFYFHDSGGHVRLVSDSTTAPVVLGDFALPEHSSSMGITTPVVAGGRLYIREDDNLFCYDVGQEALTAATGAPGSIVLAPPAAGLATERRERILRSVFVPTPQDIVERMCELAELKATDRVYDLGSGDGRIVITAATKYGCHSLGCELDEELVKSSRLKAAQAGIAQLATFEQKDLFTADVSQADVIAVYLLPAQLEKLLPQLATMKPGSRLVSHQFEIPGIAPDKSINVKSGDDGETHAIHLWTLPLRKAVPRGE